MKIKELLPQLKINGRTIYDDEKQALFMNWSCSGFSFGLKGKEIKIKAIAYSNLIPAMPNTPQAPEDWPCIALAIDEQRELAFRQEIREETWLTLWKSDEVEEHEFRVLKPSENARGKLGVLELEVDGELYKIEAKPKRIEIIGDSITCGFGNEAKPGTFEFHTIEENGWTSYAAIAARELDYDFSMICESGIQAVRAEHPLWDMHSMDDIYPYTDELYDKQMNRQLQLWDFEKNHNDIVVLNLGTNDLNPIKFSGEFSEIEPKEAWFHKKYKEFVKKVRKLNGPETYILCSLGSMDYYLYHHIKESVEEIKKEMGDERIFSFEYLPLNTFFEGIGAAGHPSQKTHDRMAAELVNYIRKFIGE